MLNHFRQLADQALRLIPAKTRVCDGLSVNGAVDRLAAVLEIALDHPGVQHLLHLKSKSKILRPIEIMGFFYEIFCQIQGNNLL